MPIYQVGPTQNASSGSGTSVVVTKPAGTANGDVLIAAFSHNDQTATASGWTLLDSQVNGLFRNELYYKVASSEGSNYTFSVPVAAPLVALVTTWRGVDTSNPVNVHTSNNTATDAEPSTTPTTGSTTSVTKPFYFRAVRFDNTTVPTFTSAASNVQEIEDFGIFSGGTVCYAHTLWAANLEDATLGTKTGIGITCSQVETNNVKRTFALTVDTFADTGTGTEGNASMTGTVTGANVADANTSVTEGAAVSVPVAGGTDTGTGTEGAPALVQTTEYMIHDNFDRQDEALGVSQSTSGHDWTSA